MSCVGVLQRGNSGDEYVLASTLCKYDLRKGDLFVLSWERVQRIRRGSITSKLLMCGGGVRSVLLLPLVARCLETIAVCIWRMFVFMSSRDIVGRSCGWVSVLSRDGITSITSLQAKSVTISTSKTITICVLYLPPSENINIFRLF